MPFKSKKQAAYLFAKKPKIAKEFAAETPDIKKLPTRIKKKKQSKKQLIKISPILYKKRRIKMNKLNLTNDQILQLILSELTRLRIAIEKIEQKIK